MSYKGEGCVRRQAHAKNCSLHASGVLGTLQQEHQPPSSVSEGEQHIITCTLVLQVLPACDFAFLTESKNYWRLLLCAGLRHQASI